MSLTWRRVLVGAALGLGIAAWLAVMGIVLVDTLGDQSTPTPTTQSLAFRSTAIPTVTLPPTVTPSPLPPTSSPAAVVPSVPPTPTDLPTPTAISTADGSAEAGVSSTEPVPFATAVPNACKPPDGWVAYTVEQGDTLFGFELGSKGQVNVAAIMAANCLKTKLLAIGQTIFLPPGVAENSPKIDDGPVGAPNLPSGPTRAANCPCTLVIRPGWRLEQIAAAIDKTPVGFSGQDFMATVGPGAPAPDLPFLNSRPAGKSLEGFMFPGTYPLENNTSAAQFRDMALNAFAANVGAQIQADAGARGLTFWQVIVLASVVQRESYSASEQKLIASVFYNRLAANKGIAATVTLQYALGGPGNWWPRVVGSMINTDSPYNTNIYPGLPPTPIASPGLDAILAAVYPAQTDYQFFSAKCGGGGNFYTRTFEEFKQGLNCGK